MFCGNCGEKLIETAISCPSCGTEVKRPAPEAEVSTYTAAASETAANGGGASAVDLEGPQYRTIGLSDTTKKLILVVLAAAAIVFLVVKFTGGGSSQSEPEKTVQSFMNAIKKENAKKMVSYMSLSSMSLPEGETADSLITMFQSQLDSSELNLRDYKITKIETFGDHATVGFDVFYMEGDSEASSEGTFDLDKIEGKWYITGGLGM